MKIKKYQITYEEWKEVLTHRTKYFIRAKGKVYKAAFQILPEESKKLDEWNVYLIFITSKKYDTKLKSTDITDILTVETNPEYFL